MGIYFDAKDVLHEIIARFTPATLPDAKKPYTLRAAHQQTLDIHGIASKAAVYNLGVSPEVIEEGLTAGLRLIMYLNADGFHINTPLFNTTPYIPGEYDGTETRVCDGTHPTIRIRTAAEASSYFKKNVKVTIDGIDQRSGFIGEATDEETALENAAATIGGLLTVRGWGLKIASDAPHSGEVGLFFDDGGGAPVKAEVVAVNQPHTLKVMVPAGLQAGTAYTLLLRTQMSVKGHGYLSKDVREIHSEFTLTAQA